MGIYRWKTVHSFVQFMNIVCVCVSYTNIDGNGNGAWMLVRRLLLFPVRSYIAAYTLCLKWSRYAQK